MFHHPIGQKIVAAAGITPHILVNITKARNHQGHPVVWRASINDVRSWGSRVVPYDIVFEEVA